MAKNEPEFTVTDRRKFTMEGEVRPDAVKQEEEEEERPRKPESTAQAQTPQSAGQAPQEPKRQAQAPNAPSAEDAARQKSEYAQSAKNIESELRAGYGPEAIPSADVNFERILEPFYLTALMQLGMMPAERGGQVAVDIVGARQTIDTLSLLQQKTDGNVSEDEARTLETVLYQLRMRYVELTNAIARSVHSKGDEPGGPAKA